MAVTGGAWVSAATWVLRATGLSLFYSSRWMLRALASAVQRAIFVLMYWPIWSGVIGHGSTASPASFSARSGAFSTATCVSFSCFTMSTGMLAGPTVPYHC